MRRVVLQYNKACDDIDSGFSSVSDLISVSPIDRDGFSETEYNMVRHITQLKDKMHEFESMANTEMARVNDEVSKFLSMAKEASSFNGEMASYKAGGFKFSALKTMTPEQQEKYDKLPQEFKDSIDKGITSVDDYRMTEDGMIICTKSLADMSQGDESEKNEYAGVYIYCIMVDGKPVYSLCQMGFDDAKDGSKLNVSFIPIDGKYINDFMTGKDSKIMDGEDLVNDGSNLRSQFGRALQGHNSDGSIPDASRQLTNYFSNTESKGALLLSDVYVETLLEKNPTNEISVKNNVSRMNDKQIARLKELGVYDESTGKIKIKDKNHLTREEYDALLVTHTANTSAYSFAAEVKYHADNCYNWFGLGKKEAVISNSGVGESSGSSFGSDLKGYTDFETESGKGTRSFRYHNDEEFAKSHGWSVQQGTNPEDDPEPVYPTPGESDPKPV